MSEYLSRNKAFGNTLQTAFAVAAGFVSMNAGEVTPLPQNAPTEKEAFTTTRATEGFPASTVFHRLGFPSDHFEKDCCITAQAVTPAGSNTLTGKTPSKYMQQSDIWYCQRQIDNPPASWHGPISRKIPRGFFGMSDIPLFDVTDMVTNPAPEKIRGLKP